MKYLVIFLKLTFCLSIYGQQYDSVIMEKDSIDENNTVYKIGNFYTYDYEIIKNENLFKLKINEKDESVLLKDTSLQNVEKIHLMIQKPPSGLPRVNEGQTEITYYQAPIFNTSSTTGVVDNKNNIWIHPIRDGFFRSLETCPFPYIKKPLKIGLKWKDKMLIGDHWCNKDWGEWKGDLLLKYKYKITNKKKVESGLGSIECYIIESFAKSTIGITKLTSYFSEEYGFVRLEYELSTGIKINFWLIDFQKEQEFNDGGTIMMTGKLIK